MPWTTNATKAASSVLTSTEWNNYVVGNTNELHDPPACRVYADGTPQTIAASTTTKILFNQERYDTDTMHSTSSNTSRITLTTAGLYLVIGCLQWATAGQMGILLLLNNANTIASINCSGTTVSDRTLSLSTVYKFDAADYVELVANNNSGAVDVDVVARFSPEFSATWIGTGA